METVPLQAQKIDFEAKVQTLTQEIHQLEKEKLAQETVARETHRCIHEITQQMPHLERERLSLQTSLVAESNAQLQHKTELAANVEQLHEKKHTSSHLQQELAGLVHGADVYRHDIQQLTVYVNLRTDESQQSTEQLRAKQLENSQLQSRTQQLDALLQEDAQAFQQLVSEREQLTRQENTHKAELSQKNESLQMLRQEITTRQTENQSLAEQCAKLQQDAEHERSKVKSTRQGELSRLQHRHAELQHQCDTLKRELAQHAQLERTQEEQDATVANIEREARQHANNAEQLQAHIITLESANNASMSTLGQIRSVRDDARAQLQQHEQQARKLQQRLDEQSMRPSVAADVAAPPPPAHAHHTPHASQGVPAPRPSEAEPPPQHDDKDAASPMATPKKKGSGIPK